MTHKVYTAIITAVREKRLNESFIYSDIHRACPRTLGIFLSKHAESNPKGYSEIFEKIGRGPFRLL
jgi:hypothetical protein